VPEKLDFAAWAPLVVTELSSSRVEEHGGTKETLRYRCQAFTRELPPLPPLVFRARPREGGPAVVSTAAAPPFRIAAAAESRPSGPAELPSELFPPPLAWRRPAALALAAVVALGWLTWQGRRRGLFARRAARATPPDAKAIARERLRALRAAEPRDAVELRAQVDAAAELVRERVAEAFGIGAPHLTSEELVAAAAAAGTAGADLREPLVRFLAGCDLVKFAHDFPGAADRAALLDDAERVVLA
jgi:hypothetical protein